MKKVRKYYLNPDKTKLICDVTINGKLYLEFSRNLLTYAVWTQSMPGIDVTTFDLELHAFLRLSHQMIVCPDSEFSEKIEEMFELDCPNI